MMKKEHAISITMAVTSVTSGPMPGNAGIIRAISSRCMI